ncbi:MAG: septal ring lytic transglycosylase RlpA family protein [Burkholderiales bacterium]
MKAALQVVLAFVAVTAAAAVYAETPSVESIVEQIQTGLASYYSRRLDGTRTASGEVYRADALIAAHPSFPLGTLARVTHVATGRFVDVRIVDRGPSSGPQRRGVIIDLSHRAAWQLDMIRAGVARVSIEVLQWGSSAR